MPGKLAAFSGPASRPDEYGPGFRALVPESYWDYFRRRRVGAVVRLNRRAYERRRFTDGGLRHHELYFPDGSCPPTELLLRFLEIAEEVRSSLFLREKAAETPAPVSPYRCAPAAPPFAADRCASPLSLSAPPVRRSRVRSRCTARRASGAPASSSAPI